MTPLADTAVPPQDLVDHLCASGVTEPGARFQTLYGGRSNQVWKALGEGGDKVLKLYRTDLPNPLFRNDPDLEAHCLRVLERSGFTPRLRAAGIHDVGNWVFYDHAPGTPWQNETQHVGRLLRRLHGLDSAIRAPKGCNGSDDLGNHAAQILAGCQSDGKQRITRLRPRHAVTPTDQCCLIHGDPVPGNILVAGTGLTLIDWQCPSIADPCEDLALFLSPAMQFLYRGAALTTTEEQEFLSAYDHPTLITRFHQLRPWYAWRMAAYCLWRAERGATDYAKALELELRAL